MKQHITQEVAWELCRDADLDWNKGFVIENNDNRFYTLCNAAIQSYINQQSKELPVLPEPAGAWEDVTGTEMIYGFPAEIIEMRDAWSKEQVEAYTLAWGDHRAAHARELALDEARLLADSTAGLNAQWLVDQIEALKGK